MYKYTNPIHDAKIKYEFSLSFYYNLRNYLRMRKRERNFDVDKFVKNTILIL